MLHGTARVAPVTMTALIVVFVVEPLKAGFIVMNGGDIPMNGMLYICKVIGTGGSDSHAKEQRADTS
jgi:hypothetical protein